MSKAFKKKINSIKRFYSDVYKIDSNLISELKKMDTEQAGKESDLVNGKLIINFDDRLYENTQVLETQPSIIETRPINEYRRLTRGISSASGNDDLAWALSDDCEPVDVRDDAIFLLPDINVYPEDFRKFLEKDLLDNTTLTALESAGRVNWWASRNGADGDVTRLLALWTRGDGSCAAHAARLGARGVHDRRLVLRRALHAVLAADSASNEKERRIVHNIQRRWRHALSEELASAGAHHVHNDDMDSGESSWWQAEWDSIIRRARRTADALEPIHLLALAHAIKRPIVVYADTILKDFAGLPLAPIPFGGVFMPLELETEECTTSPVLLAYHAGHFSALVPSSPSVEDGGGCQTFVLPLHDRDGVTMPVHFTVDPGEEKSSESTKVPMQSSKPPRPLRKRRNVSSPTEEKPPVVQDSKSIQTDRELALIFKYLDVVELPADIGVPGKSFRHSMDEICNNGGKTSTKTKQFGSIGRSFGSRLKNLGRKIENKGKLEKRLSISSDGTLSSAANGNDTRLWFRVKAARSPLQDEMIRNYLNDALRRYHSTILPQNKCDDLYPTLRYGTGRSRFYAETERLQSDNLESKKTTKCTKSNSIRPNDRTLYLSKSTFYDDRPLITAQSSDS